MLRLCVCVLPASVAIAYANELEVTGLIRGSPQNESIRAYFIHPAAAAARFANASAPAASVRRRLLWGSDSSHLSSA